MNDMAGQDRTSLGIFPELWWVWGWSCSCSLRGEGGGGRGREGEAR
jgi:hypothetical protein